MDATFRRTMHSVTDVLFPVSKNARDPQQHQMLKTGNEYVTNLPLQMLIYFNVFFSPLWFIASIVMLEAKFSYLTQLYQIVLVSVYIVYTLIELVRLYLGFVGNLMERVPELAGFWLLTMILQFPLILLLLLNDDALLLPLERAVHIIKALFVVSEVIVGYFAIRVMVNYQVTKYHLQQFTDLEHVDEDSYYPESRYTS
ncbi:transmembrane protein 17B-like [Littorina saxatilis]|uniref:Transmembrane protein 17 n=1 Tax=Littorina saxatilis TaxID=31220 RepID=A0AAN9AJS1_9CAEN